jgi:hypothetical protein
MSSSSSSLGPKTIKALLDLMADKADEVLKNDLVMGGITALVMDDCRRLLAEAACVNGMPDLDRSYGRIVNTKQPAGSRQSLFDELQGEQPTRPRVCRTRIEEDAPPSLASRGSHGSD